MESGSKPGPEIEGGFQWVENGHTRSSAFRVSLWKKKSEQRRRGTGVTQCELHGESWAGIE